MKLLVCVLLVAAVACAEEKPKVETEKKFEKRGIVKITHPSNKDQSNGSPNSMATSTVSISFGNKQPITHSNNHKRGDTKVRNIERLNNLGRNYRDDSSKLLTSSNFDAQRIQNSNFETQQNGNKNFEPPQFRNNNFGAQQQKGNYDFSNNFREFENSFNSYSVPNTFTTNTQPENNQYGNNFKQTANQDNNGNKNKVGSYSSLYGGVHTNAGVSAINKPVKDVAGVNEAPTPNNPVITENRAHVDNQKIINVYLDDQTGLLRYNDDANKGKESENNFVLTRNFENNDNSNKEKDSEPTLETISSLENNGNNVNAFHFAEGPPNYESGSNNLDWTPVYKNPYEYSGADIPITQPIKKSYMGNNFGKQNIYVGTQKQYVSPKQFESSKYLERPKYFRMPKYVETPKHYLTPAKKERIESITIQKEVKYPVLKPYPVAVYKHIAVPVLKPVAYHVDKPYPVYVAKPYHVPIFKPVPYTVIKHVPYTVHIPIKVPVFHHIPIHISKPVPYHVPFHVKVPVAQHYTVPKPIPIYYKSHKSLH